MKVTGKVINQSWGGYVFEFVFGNWTIDPVMFSRIKGASVASVGELWQFDVLNTDSLLSGSIPTSATKL